VRDLSYSHSFSLSLCVCEWLWPWGLMSLVCVCRNRTVWFDLRLPGAEIVGDWGYTR